MAMSTGVAAGFIMVMPMMIEMIRAKMTATMVARPVLRSCP